MPHINAREGRLIIETTLSVLTIYLLSFLIRFAPKGGLSGEIFGSLPAFFMLFIPLFILQKENRDIDEIGFILKGSLHSLKRAIVLFLITVPLFGIGFHIWQLLLFDRQFVLRFPHNTLYLIFVHIFGVALPEELFFRGYLHDRLKRLIPPTKMLFGVKVGLYMLVVAIIFSVGHIFTDPRPVRLGVIFPSVLFSWMREKDGTIAGCTLYHGLSNVLVRILEYSYFGY